MFCWSKRFLLCGAVSSQRLPDAWLRKAWLSIVSLLQTIGWNCKRQTLLISAKAPKMCPQQQVVWNSNVPGTLLTFVSRSVHLHFRAVRPIRDATISNHPDLSHLDANFCCSQLHSHMSEIAKRGPYHAPWSPHAHKANMFKSYQSYHQNQRSLHGHVTGSFTLIRWAWLQCIQTPSLQLLAACATVQTKVWRSISDIQRIQRTRYKYLTKHLQDQKRS